MRFPAKISSSCVWVALIELFYIGMPVVRTDGRSVYGHVITKFTYPWCSAGARLARARAPL